MININKIKNIRIFYPILFSIFYFLFSGSFVLAASFSVTPVVIDEKAGQKDVLKESVFLTNTVNHKIIVYPFVKNISRQSGQEEFLDPSRADLSSSLANWIRISRGVMEIPAGESKKIDFTIEVDLFAKPGIYHAAILFGEGSTRDDAEAKLKEGVTVNLEVLENIKEKLQLKKFVSDKVFFSSFPVSFSYEFENIGNRPAVPSGQIRIYNRRGEEVAVFDANSKNLSIENKQSVVLASRWESGEKQSQGGENQLALSRIIWGNRGFGKFKAVLDIEYGTNQRQTLQDTVFFWIIPWRLILILFLLLAAFLTSAAYFFHKRYEYALAQKYRK